MFPSHVVIFQFLNKFERYYTDSFKLIDNFHEVLNFNWLPLKRNQFICGGLFSLSIVSHQYNEICYCNNIVMDF